MFLPPSTLRLVQHAPRSPLSPLSLLHSCPNSDMSACSAAVLHFPASLRVCTPKREFPDFLRKREKRPGWELGCGGVVSGGDEGWVGVELIFGRREPTQLFALHCYEVEVIRPHGAQANQPNTPLQTQAETCS